jgi:hypothetical protein
MEKDTEYEKIMDYLSYLEKNKYEVVKEEIDWDNLYEEPDSYDDIVFNF